MVPVVNKIDVHPYLTNEAVCFYDREHGIATEAWSPIAPGRGARGPHHYPDRRTSRKTMVFPKSVSPSCMKENF